MSNSDHNPLLWTAKTAPILNAKSKSELSDDIKQFSNKLHELGIEYGNSGRIAQAINIFKSLGTHGPLEYSDDATIGVLFDVIQLHAIANYCSLTSDADYKSKAMLLLKDSLEPISSMQRHTPGRDTQFELFANACWSATGVDVALGSPSPDIIVRTSLGEFGIEVKRTKNAKQ